MKPWLGAQEAHYASNVWHLEVDGAQPSQMAGVTDRTSVRRVAPGKSLVMSAFSSDIPADQTVVRLAGQAEYWITDLERATSMPPKLYGFDFARVQEVYEFNREKRLVTDLGTTQRRDHPGHHGGGSGDQPRTGEYAMMYDLMVSCLADGAEVCVSYHMMNPLFQTSGISTQAPDVGAALAIGDESLMTADLAANDTIRSLVEENCKRYGALLKAVLDHPLVSASAEPASIYIRLLHEPNIHSFWWCQPTGYSKRSALEKASYQSNYRKLWMLMVNAIRTSLESQARKDQVKFVFSINGQSWAPSRRETGNGQGSSRNSDNGTDGTPGNSGGASDAGSAGDADDGGTDGVDENVDVVVTSAAQANALFQASLDDFFPTVALSSSDPNVAQLPDGIREFFETISVIGLDYYEDHARDPAHSLLRDQYDLLIGKVTVLSGARLRVEHALTEVSFRTNFQGRLYSIYGSAEQWEPGKRSFDGSAEQWEPGKRSFFRDCVLPIVKRKSPKWVMFWVNRFGNSALSGLTPSSGAWSDGWGYGKHPPQFDDPRGESYFPILPANEFHFSSLPANDNTAVQQFFKSSALTDAVMKAMGVEVEGNVNVNVNVNVGVDVDEDVDGPPKLTTVHRDRFIDPYLSAMVDFSSLISSERGRHNARNSAAVCAYERAQKNEISIERPTLAADAAVRASDFFETL